LFLLLEILFVIGMFSGIITGLLSVGGGFILIICLLMVPPLFHIQLSLQAITFFAIIQAFFATISGAIYYLKSKLVDHSMILFMGLPAMFGGAAGSFLSQFLLDSVLKIIFAAMATAASVMMLFPSRSSEYDNAKKFSKTLAVAIGFSTGVIGGLIGVAAGFIFVPVLMYIFKLPIRKAIGSSLITCFLLALGGGIVKVGTQSIPMEMVAVLVGGGIIGAQLGGRLNKFIKTMILKKMVAVVIGAISIRIFFKILF
jgi:uncharacterized membrane protein YfcA